MPRANVRRRARAGPSPAPWQPRNRQVGKHVATVPDPEDTSPGVALRLDHTAGLPVAAATIAAAIRGKGTTWSTTPASIAARGIP
jgi:hypothetical protein